MTSTRSATAPGNVFIGGKFIELGLNQRGGFGSAPGVPIPEGFFGRKSGSGIGMVSDIDGFDFGVDNRIDYFLPGSPEERWSVAFMDGGAGRYGGFSGRNPDMTSSGVSLSGATISDVSALSGIAQAKFTGTLAADGSGALLIEAVHSLGESNKYFESTVKITNISGRNLDNVRFMRSFDPDNTVDIGGSYVTTNKIEHQAASSGLSLVSASSGYSSYSSSYGEIDYIGYLADDPRSHVYSGGFSNANPYDPVAMPDLVGFQETVDGAIGIVFSLGNLAPGGFASLSYKTVLSYTEARSIVPPTVLITSDKPSLKSGETATVTFSFSEDPGTSFTWDGKSGDVAVSNGVLSAVGGTGLTRTATFTPTPNLASGEATITVAAGSYTDPDGNRGLLGTSPIISVDTLAPSVAITSDKATITGGETATITFSFSEDPGTSFKWDGKSGDVEVSNGVLSAVVGTGLTRTATFTPTPNLASGKATITVAAGSYTDPNGNPGLSGATSGISIDTLAPSVAITSNKASLGQGQTATITLTFSEDPGTSFKWDGKSGDVAVSNGVLSAVAGTGLTRTATFTPTPNLASGAANIAVLAGSYTDPNGNLGLPGTAPIISIDTLAPTVAITSNKASLGQGETATITLTFSEDPGTSFKWDGESGDVEVSNGVLSAVTGTGLTRMATFTPSPNLASGKASILVAAGSYTDANGNPGLSAATPGISIDTLVPTVVISSSKTSLSAGETATITFTLSESSTNFLATDVSSMGGSLSSFSGSGTSYTATFTPNVNSIANGVVSVASGTFSDAAGNTNADGADADNTVTMTANTITPSVALSADKTALKIGDTATITFTLSEASSDFTLADITVTGGNLTSVAPGGKLASLDASGTSYSAIFTPQGGTTTSGEVKVASGVFRNAAGNANADGGDANNTIVFASDFVAPRIALTSDKALLKAGETATISFSLTEASTNFAVGDVELVGGTLSGLSGSGSSYTAIFTPSANSTGAARVSVGSGKFSDAAGNLNADGAEANNRVDLKVATVVPTIALTSDKTSLKAGETANVTFELSAMSTTFTASDVTVSGGKLEGFRGGGSRYSATFKPAENSTTAGAISVGSGVFSDAAGNLNADGAEANNKLAWTIDTLRPTIALSSNMSALKAGDKATITVTLSEASSDFVASDVTVTGGALSAFTGSGSSYSAVFTPTSGSSGSATLSVKSASFSDAAGNLNADGAEANNTLSLSRDTVAPKVALRSNKASVKAGETATITFTLSEASRDFTVADLTASSGSFSNFAGSGTSYTATWSPATGSSADVRVSVASGMFSDAAGNLNADGAEADNATTIKANTVTPTIALTSDKSVLKAGETATITFSLSESARDFGLPDVTVKGGQLSGFAGTGAKYTAVFTPDKGGASSGTLSVASGKFSNAGGNFNADGADANNSLTLTTDVVVPTVALSSNKSALLPTETATITFTLSEASSDFTLADVTVSGGTLSSFAGSGTTYTATYTPTFGTTASKNQVSVASGKFSDAAGNFNADGAEANNSVSLEVPLVLMGTPQPDSLTGGSGNDYLSGLQDGDTLTGGPGQDTLIGGPGSDRLIGGPGADVFVFSAGDGTDQIDDYKAGASGLGDVIRFSVPLAIGGSSAAATTSQASINATTGVATFANRSGLTMEDALGDIASRLSAAGDALGEFALFRLNMTTIVRPKGTEDMYIFISDGVAGVSANDVLVRLSGIPTVRQIDLSGGDFVIVV